MAGPGVIPKSTGLTGLALATNPRHTLHVLYKRLIKTLNSMPENTAYRRYTEEIVNTRLNALDSSKSIDDFVKTVNCGQVEEIILQAENEILLSRMLLKYKPWERLIQQPLPDQWKWPPAK